MTTGPGIFPDPPSEPESGWARDEDRRRIASLAAVIAAAFGVGMAFGVGFPLTALTLESWATPKWLIGIAGAAPAMGVLATLPFLPGLVARWGAVRAISVGCLVGAAGFIALGLFQDVHAWIVIRFLMSAGLALPWLAGETWINLVTREETRGRVIAIYAISFFSGYSVGPLLLEATGLSGYAPYLVGAGAMAFAGLPIVLAARLAPDVSEKGSDHSPFSAVRLAPVGMMGGFIGGFAEMSYLALIGNVGIAGGLEQATALRLMSFLTAGGVVLQFLIGYLADKMARTLVTIALGIAFIVLSLLLPAALAHPPMAFPLAFVLGGVVLGFYTVGLAVVGEEVQARDLAAANAAFLVMYQLGAILGPAAAGFAMSISPVAGFVYAMALFMLLALAGVLWLWRRQA
ncbi:MAG: MFS transporter [Hyphomicrobiaceae bacterium]|nr:MFS transporter [Hyphomicrobiaceae bacterium]